MRELRIRLKSIDKPLVNGVRLRMADVDISDSIDDLSLEELDHIVRCLNHRLQEGYMQRQQMEYELTWNI